MTKKPVRWKWANSVWEAFLMDSLASKFKDEKVTVCTVHGAFFSLSDIYVVLMSSTQTCSPALMVYLWGFDWHPPALLLQKEVSVEFIWGFKGSHKTCVWGQCLACPWGPQAQRFVSIQDSAQSYLWLKFITETQQKPTKQHQQGWVWRLLETSF